MAASRQPDSTQLSISQPHSIQHIPHLLKPAKYDKKSEELHDEAVSIEAPIKPLENRMLSEFIKVIELPKNTFHSIVEYVEKSKDTIRKFFYKCNPPSEYSLAIYMSELEAVCAALYKFLTPHHAPNTQAVCDENNVYVGVVSEELAGFKPVSSNPIKESDLNVSFIHEKKISYNVLDKIDEQLRKHEATLVDLDNRLKKLKQNEIDFENEEKNIQIDQHLMNANFEKQQRNSENIIKLRVEIKDCKDTINKVYHDLEKTHTVSKIQFERYRIVKGLALGLTASYLYMEDDLHQNNMSKDGMRIDFDMSIWDFLYDFSDKGFFDSIRRKPDPSGVTFRITEHDIKQFPDTKDATPYYWPTHMMRKLTEAALTALKKFYPMSTNVYPAEANKTYSDLKTNPVFIHYKFSTMMKFMLMQEDVFEKIITLHLRKEATIGSVSVIEKMKKRLVARVTELRNVLVKMPEFIEFFNAHGETVKENLRAQVAQRNSLFRAKAKAAKASQGNQSKFVHDALLAQVMEQKNFEDSYKTLSDMIQIQSMAVKLEEKPALFMFVKAAVIAAMENYKSPGLMGLGGWWRTNSTVADKILTYCKNLTMKSDESKVGIEMIRERLLLEKNKLEKGGMFDALTALLGNESLFPKQVAEVKMPALKK